MARSLASAIVPRTSVADHSRRRSITGSARVGNASQETQELAAGLRLPPARLCRV